MLLHVKFLLKSKREKYRFINIDNNAVNGEADLATFIL